MPKKGAGGMEQPKKLKAKEERFCQEYIVDYNGTQAAIRAGTPKVPRDRWQASC